MKNKILTLVVFIFIRYGGYAQISYGGRPMSMTEESLLSTLRNVNTIEMEAFDHEQEVEDSRDSRPLRFARPFPVNIDVKSAGTRQEVQGGNIYRLGITSKDAYSLNIIFNRFILSQNSRLFMFNSDLSDIIGEFNHQNNSRTDYVGLACAPVSGDSIYIELFEPFEEYSECIIGQVAHDFLGIFVKSGDDFGKSGECNNDVNCSFALPFQKEKASVCMVVIYGINICSGAVINNTNENGEPLFLTAFLCYNGTFSDPPQILINNSVFIFNYESPTCNGSNGSKNQSISGGTLISSSNTTDYLILVFPFTIPSNFFTYYSGWDRSDGPPANTFTIHHPSGDVKKITFDNDPPTISPIVVNTNAGPCTGVAGQPVFWKVGEWESGTTEGGASGSPLFNPNHRIIGQLWRGCAACEGTSPNNLPDVFGMVHHSWTLGLQPVLDPQSILVGNEFLGLRYMRNHVIGTNMVINGDVVKFENVIINGNADILVNELQDRFEVHGTLEIDDGVTFEVH